MSIQLYQIDKTLKKFLLLFIITLTIGVTIGLFYVRETTAMTPEGTITRWKGSQENLTEFHIPSDYPKSISEMLMTTHNHVIGFSIIFFAIGIVFYFNSIITGFWKSILIVEPFISTLLTFGSIWGIRFIDSSFIYITIFSSTLLYSSYYIMAGVCIYELLFKKMVSTPSV